MLAIIAFGYFLVLSTRVEVESTARFSYLGQFACVDQTTGCSAGATGPSQVYGPAFALAVSDALKNSAAMNNINFTIINTIEASPIDRSDYKVAQTNAMDTTQIGMMGFDSACSQIPRMLQSFNDLVISILCDIPQNTLKNSKSLIQFAPSSRSKSLSVLSLLNKMGWDVAYVAAIGRSADDFMVAQYEDLVSLLLNNNIKVNSSFVLLDAPPYSEKRILQLVMDNYLDSRVFIVIDNTVYGDFAVRLVDTMSRFGLLETGEYFVITLLDDYKTDYWMADLTNNYFFSSIVYDNNMRCVPTFLSTQQWRSVGLISFLPPMENESSVWKTFVDRMWETYSSPPCPPLCTHYTDDSAFDKSYGYHAIPYWKSIAITYDATAFIVKQLNNAIDAGINIFNGSAVRSFIRNQKIKSVTGRDIYLNSYGAALHQYQFLIPLELQSDDGIMIDTLAVVADFIPNDDLTYKYVLRNNSVGFQFINGNPPSGKPRCGFRGELCLPKQGNSLYLALGATFVIATFVIILIFVRQQQQFEKSLQQSNWKISSSAITIKGVVAHDSTNDSSIVGVAGSLFEDLEPNNNANNRLLLKDYVANLKKANDRPPSRQKKRNSLLKSLVSISSEFLNKIYGFVYEPPKIFMVSAYCSRNSMKEILENEDIRLENMFNVSFIMDILKGLQYLHQSKLGYHGNLKSKTCLVEASWRVVLTNFGMANLREGEIVDDSDLMWTAPELLRRNNKKVGASHSFLQHADVYSFSIILHEILSRAGVWGGETLSYSEILERIKFPKDDHYFRPNLTLIKDKHPAPFETCKACWAEQPDLRPKVSRIRDMIRPFARGMKTNIADNIMTLLDKYKNNLHDVVRERTAQLEEERMRSERLLLQLLPEQVAHALKNDEPVEAQHYSSVTIYFSDIVGFTFMSSESTPMQVVEFLNDLYTVFDTALSDFDVYKVETIGDAYMMASGLPKPNGINHAGEVASTALRLLDSIQNFKISHRPNDPLKLRMGIHSGDVVTGVVGLKMPRYCLFGQCVNTALRMESYGLPRKIQISSQTKELLEQLGGYDLEERGYIDIGGKEKHLTYWLNGADQSARLERLKIECLQYPSLKRASKGTIFD